MIIPVLKTGSTTRTKINSTPAVGRNFQNIRPLPQRNTSKLDVRLWNARSTRNKTMSIADFVLDCDIDILFITETWLALDDPVVIGELTPTGYSFISHPRGTSNHGGIGIIFKSSVKLFVKPFKFTAHTFEYICICNGRNSITFAAIYRPPPLNDLILNSLHRSRVVFVVLLDLSAAFDTVDYNILLNRLSKTFHVTQTAHQWFASYLHGHTNRVSIEGVFFQRNN